MLVALLSVTAVAVVSPVVHPADAATQSQLTVTSQDTTGASLSGYYVTLYDGLGNALSNGYTPTTLTLNNGQSYFVEVDGYGSCNFDHWADTGSTNNTRSISIGADTQITAVLNNCGTGTTTTTTSTSTTTTTTTTTSSSGGGPSSVSVNSVDMNNNAITGYYVVLYGSSGSVMGSGFTPATFSTTSGQQYSIEADDYGSCTFSHWSNGMTANPMPFTASNSAQTFTALYNCGTTTTTTTSTTTTTTTTTSTTSTTTTSTTTTSTSTTTSTTTTSTSTTTSTTTSSTTSGGGPSGVTVNSVDSSNNAVSGFYVALLDSGGNVVASGFTPAKFTTTSGVSYAVQADGYGTCTFSNWSDGVVNNPRSFTGTTSTLTFTAVYACGGGGGGEHGAGPGTITIYDHRIPADYWDPCFASTCTNPMASCLATCTGPGASMWVVLYDSAGNVVGSGFSNENGYTFTGLNPSATYYLYPSDCNLCHNSTHDVLFANWGDGTTTRPLPVVANGAYKDAWYTCTNGCGGG